MQVYAGRAVLGRSLTAHDSVQRGPKAYAAPTQDLKVVPFEIWFRVLTWPALGEACASPAEALSVDSAVPGRRAWSRR